MGLAGTGSNTVTVENAFVPDHRILKFDDLVAGRTPGSPDHVSPVYRAPLWSVFPFSIASMGPGMARGAFDTFVAEKRAEKVMANLPPAKKFSMQMRVSEAGALVDAAELLFRRSLRETIDMVMAGQPLPIEMRARNRRDQSYAVSLSKKAVELLLQAEGSRGLFEGGHIQRAARDLHAASVHLAVAWEPVAMNYGEIVLGGEPIDHMF
jgi:3-hydroxy-9,10-secoandrosta-1,3,5(10)-triene-9,17-dione monooxygenase